MAIVGMGEALGFDLGEQVGEDASGDPTLVMSDEQIAEILRELVAYELDELDELDELEG